VHASRLALTELSAQIPPLLVLVKHPAWAARWAEAWGGVREWVKEEDEVVAGDGDAGWLK